MMRDNHHQFLTVPGESRRLAYRQREAAGSGIAKPGVVWLGGFKSDMTSSKAAALDGWAEREGRGFLRFDYAGHGLSDGSFADGTIGAWHDDAIAAIRGLTDGPQVLVGSSMGGWIALLAARTLAARGEAARLAGMVLIAPAVDFTERLMWDQFTPAIRARILRDGSWLRPSAYAEDPYPITRGLIEDGRRHLLLNGPVRSHAPVHILQGMQDAEVPWQHAMLLVEHLAHDPVSLTLIKDGNHRLSRDQDIAALIRAVEGIA